MSPLKVLGVFERFLHSRNGDRNKLSSCALTKPVTNHGTRIAFMKCIGVAVDGHDTTGASRLRRREQYLAVLIAGVLLSRGVCNTKVGLSGRAASANHQGCRNEVVSARARSMPTQGSGSKRVP